ncbi:MULTISPECIES: hypothetical protein [Cyclobacterium]|uniref:hypothetical protein n=1 Tax=Cyclobacterium TaxID=68288 RepID=UPI001391CB91|nr:MULTISPECIES: hypothetical protein [Cyclobacterium]
MKKIGAKQLIPTFSAAICLRRTIHCLISPTSITRDCFPRLRYAALFVRPSNCTPFRKIVNVPVLLMLPLSITEKETIAVRFK